KEVFRCFPHGVPQMFLLRFLTQHIAIFLVEKSLVISEGDAVHENLRDARCVDRRRQVTNVCTVNFSVSSGEVKEMELTSRSNTTATEHSPILPCTSRRISYGILSVCHKSLAVNPSAQT
ncbi:hypothetical protein TGPRC2_424230, partial [Toxoplasma gondii TgCatPRC2]